MTPKTYKREVGVVVALIALGFGVWSVFDPNAVPVATTLIPSAIGLLAVAFGLDSYMKQKR